MNDKTFEDAMHEPAMGSATNEETCQAADGPAEAQTFMEALDATNEEISNNSGNRPFADVVASRRAVLAGGFGVLATTFFDSATPAAAHGSFWGWGHTKKPLIGFTPVPVAEVKASDGKTPLISADYEYQVLIPWGESLYYPGVGYQGEETRPTAEQQANLIGIGHDGMWFFPMDYNSGRHGNFDHFCRKNRHTRSNGLLVLNHEYGENGHILGKSNPESLDDVRTSQHAHGVSVVEIKKARGKWQQVKSKYARRIHVNTPVEFSGPVAGHALLKNAAGNPFQGTLNNCANGHTPWGTYLTCEENYPNYFAANTPASFTQSVTDKRYSFSANGSFYGWHPYDPRFDLSNADYANERHRFGWVVEIDPTNPNKKPVKRTALGRFKHEGVGLVEGKGGKVVCYMGDDQAFDYIYKFVSADSWQKILRRGKSPLDEGTLYAAKFNDDGTGQWLALDINQHPELKSNSIYNFTSQAEVLTYARLAADVLGATPMDRPEWTTIAPNGDVYCTLTNNSSRTTTNAANPVAPNRQGHIIRWHDADQHVGTTFTWDIFILAKDTQGTENSFASPDGLWADDDGRLFIQTDGTQETGLRNQMLVADTKDSSVVKRLFVGVKGDEITGIAITPDQRTMFINIQHAGDGDPNATNFPANVGVGTGPIPRDCTIVITKKDGGIIGS